MSPHSNSGINAEEYKGVQRAPPEGVTLVAIRVRQDTGGMRLRRHDEHPVQRGVCWQRTARHGLPYTNGFKPRTATYDGFEVPVPLSISIKHGDGDILQVAKDILGLTKLNYNSCQLGGHPITVKYSDRGGGRNTAGQPRPNFGQVAAQLRALRLAGRATA